MKKLSVLFALIMCLLCLSGCWDKRELEDNTFAVLLGIDIAESNDVTVTIAFPLTQAEGGGGDKGAAGGGGNYSVMSAKAPTVVEALNMLGTKLAAPLALHSIKTIVISQDIARSDMLRHVFSSWRYEEIRNTTNVLISECKAAKFIDTRITNPLIDPMRQEELLLEQANGSAYYKPIGLLELLASLKSGSGDGIAMYGGIAAKSEDEGKQSGADDIEEQVKDGYLPDDIPVTAENESGISGLAVFRGARMVGVLNSSESQTYSMLTNSNARIIRTLPDPLKPECDIVVGILPRKTRIYSAINDEAPVFNIEVSLECTVECIQSEVDYTLINNYNVLTEYIRKACAVSMTKLVAKAQKEFGADILMLGDKLAHHFGTVGEWERYNWPEKYNDAEIILTANLNIERTGIMVP